MKRKGVMVTVWVLVSLIALFILTVLGYVLYVVIDYNRIDDNLALEVENNTTQTIMQEQFYTVMSYNIGFGAYSHDFSFFMDSGEMLTGKKVSGVNSKAKDKATVEKNTQGAINVISSYSPDFVLFQEVDIKATRSRNVNQKQLINDAFPNMASTFAVNFDSAYLMYPFNDPHGKSLAGLMTLSNYKIDSSIRRSYPVSTSFAKFFDLDRCFDVMYLPVDGGKTLCLINSHMSAYDEGGTIREQQLAMLNQIMKEEYEKGNYVIVGGDFNHDIAGSLNSFTSQQKVPEWVYVLEESDLAEGFRFASAKNVPTCRSTDMPYTKGVNYSVVLDGFIISPNVEIIGIKNIDTDFEFSDHNPVLFTFKLF